MTRFARIPMAFRPNVTIEFHNTYNIDNTHIVDDSQYVPNKQALQILARNAAAQTLDNLLFDNPEDIKNGAVNVYARQKKRDLAELTQQSRRLQSQLQQDLKNAQAQQAQAQQAQQAQQAAVSTAENPIAKG